MYRNPMLTRRDLLAGSAAMIAATGGATAQAAYPNRPVRVIVPWGYGFKNVKGLQRLRLTTDTKPLNTYGGDPDSYVKTMAWPEGPATFKAGQPITVRGAAVWALSQLMAREEFRALAADRVDAEIDESVRAEWQLSESGAASSS